MLAPRSCAIEQPTEQYGKVTTTIYSLLLGKHCSYKYKQLA